MERLYFFAYFRKQSRYSERFQHTVLNFTADRNEFYEYEMP